MMTTGRMQWQVPVFADELDELLAERILHYVTSTDGTFEADVVIDATPPGLPPTAAPTSPTTPTPPVGAAPPASTPSASPSEPEPAATTRRLTLPRFTYSTEARKPAPSLFSSSLSTQRIWAYELRKTIPAPLQTLLNLHASSGRELRDTKARLCVPHVRCVHALPGVWRGCTLILRSRGTVAC